MAFRLLDSFLPWDLRYTNTKKRLRLRENQGERKENQRSVAGEGANGNQSQPWGNCHPMIPDGLHARFSIGRGDRLGENPFTANWLGGSKDWRSSRPQFLDHSAFSNSTTEQDKIARIDVGASKIDFSCLKVHFISPYFPLQSLVSPFPRYRIEKKFCISCTRDRGKINKV